MSTERSKQMHTQHVQCVQCRVDAHCSCMALLVYVCEIDHAANASDASGEYNIGCGACSNEHYRATMESEQKEREMKQLAAHVHRAV